MSNEELRIRIAGEVQSAELARHAKRRSVAAGELFEAILLAMSAEPGPFRQVELTKLAVHCRTLWFEDLSLFAFVQAARESENMGEHERASTLMIEVGSLYSRLANLDEAAHWYQRARADGLAHSCYANAASASTNLATLAMAREDWPAAHQLASDSLDFLCRQPSPRTEAITRAVLILLAEHLDRPIDEALDHARTLFGALAKAPVPEQVRKDAAAALDRLVQKYLSAHPEVDGPTWKHAQLPALW